MRRAFGSLRRRPSRPGVGDFFVGRNDGTDKRCFTDRLTAHELPTIRWGRGGILTFLLTSVKLHGSRLGTTPSGSAAVVALSGWHLFFLKATLGTSPSAEAWGRAKLVEDGSAYRRACQRRRALADARTHRYAHGPSAVFFDARHSPRASMMRFCSAGVDKSTCPWAKPSRRGVENTWR